MSVPPRTIPITATRPTTAGNTLSLFRANPVDFVLSLDATRESLTGVESLNVELRSRVTDTETALARTTVDIPTGAGPFTLSLTGAQMNQDLDGEASASFWLVVYTLDDSGNTLDVLYTAPVSLKEHGASLTAAAPPNVVGAITRPAADLLYASQDAATASATAITTLIDGVTANDASKKIFSSQTHTGTPAYVRSTTCWARSLDMTGLGVWNSEFGVQIGFAAISPDHVAICHHTTLTNGTTLRWVTAGNVIVERTLTSSVRVGTSDLRIGKLSASLPSTIKPLTLPGPDFFQTPALALTTDQENKALIASLAVRESGSLLTFAAASGDAAGFYEEAITGDSGHALALVQDGELALASTYLGSNSGPDVQALYDSIIAAAAGLGGAVPDGNLPQTIPWENVRRKPAFGSLAYLTPTGTATNTKFLRGDNTWAVMSGGSGGSGLLEAEQLNLAFEDASLENDQAGLLNSAAATDVTGSSTVLALRDHAGLLRLALTYPDGSSPAISPDWLTGSTAAGRTLLIAANAAAQRTALGLGTLATQSGTIADYLTSATAAATYQPLSPVLSGLTGASGGYGLLFNDGFDGFTYAAPDTDYLTPGTAATTYQPLNTKLTNISNLANGSGVLTNNGSGTLSWAASSGSGTVTSASVATANGFAGTVANATTTPAITISTSVTGLLKGNGTAVSSATADTDYLTPATAASTYQPRITAAAPQPPTLPIYATTADSGVWTGGGFNAAWTPSGGAIRFKGSIVNLGLLTILQFDGGAGPVVFDVAGELRIRFRTAAGADAVSYDTGVRSTAAFDLVLAWRSGTGPGRTQVWLDGILKTPTSEDTALVIGTNQTGLTWGATGMTVDELAVYPAHGGVGDLTGIVTSTGNATSIADGAIALAKLATDPLARANHTGTQAASTITGLGTAATTDATAYATAAQGALAATATQPGDLGTAAMFDVNVAANPATEEVVTTAATQTLTNKTIAGLPVEFQIACSDLSSAITAGTNKAYFRAPFAFTLTAVRASVLTAPTGSTILIDINESGTTVLSTKIMIDASEKTSTTAATAPVISDSAIADDAEITIDFDQVGATIAGAGVIVTLIGTR